MTTEKAINGKALYTPKGAALEYGRIGCNFYTGCPHECVYCYLKRGAPSKQLGGTEVRLKKCFKDVAHAADTLRQELDEHLEQCQRHGIFLSFTTDPLIDETRGLTGIAIMEAVKRKIPVWVLTKNAVFVHDKIFTTNMLKMAGSFPNARRNIHFGFTLTGRDDMEPKASTNHDRIMAMYSTHMVGFATFASVEPVIDWPSAERIVKESLPFCDHYKLGLRSGVKRDYYDISESVNAIHRIVKAVEAHNKTIYLKESTRRLLRQGLTSEDFYELLSHTVNMDGNYYESTY